MPRLPPKWPPIFETTSIMRWRISSASSWSCRRLSDRRSCGELMVSRSVIGCGASRSPFADETRDPGEIVHRTADDSSVADCLAQERVDGSAGGLRAEERRVGQLPLRQILAGRLPERGCIFFLVQEVI